MTGPGAEVLSELYGLELIELGHVLNNRMPRLGAHPAFLHALLERHGEHPSALEGISHANDLVSMGLHTGAHMDALGHISRRGEVHGGVPAAHLEQGSGPLAVRGAEELASYVVPGVLFDIPKVRGVAALEPTDEVTVDDLTRALGDRELPDRGWAGLVRTGWGQHWIDGKAAIYAGRRGGMPGPRLEAAQWMAERGTVVVGSDTAGFEAFPAEDWYVHGYLLVDCGIPIMENLNLEALGARSPSEFAFVGLPIQVQGGTAGPLRPVALLPAAAR